MKKTGQLLKEAREAQGISIQEVSVHLKINNRILRALEEGDRQQLPAKTFLRGFVRSYAQFLRMSEKEILSVFQTEMGTTHPNMITTQVDSSEVVATEPLFTHQSTIGLEVEKEGPAIPAEPHGSVNKSEPEKASLPSNPTVQAPFQATTPIPSGLSIDQKTWSKSMQIATVAVVVIIGVVIYGVVKTIEKYEREAYLVSQPPIEEQGTSSASDVSEGPLMSQNEIEAVTSSNTSPIPVPSSSVATNKEGVSATSAVPSTAQELIVEALDRVVVEYLIDGQPKASMVLNAEKVHTFRGEKQLQLWLSDGGSVNLIYNGKDRGVPGTLGKPLKLTFP